MADEHEREDQRQSEILISDKRHSRDIDTAAEERAPTGAAEEAQAEKKPAPATTAGEAVGPAPAGRGTAEPPAGAPPPTATPEAAADQPPPLEDFPEAAQLRVLFEAGLPAYLHSQLQLVLNFAMIYLGRQPNPANGLVSADLENARLAIDLFDFIVKRTQNDLPQQDRAGLANLVGSLKMEYAQVAQASAKPPAGGSEP
jgi:hypothetical protein